MSPGQGSLLLWYKPTGTAGATDPADCFNGERLFGNYENPAGPYMGIYRHGNLGGNNRLCAWNWDDDEDRVEATYTTNVWTHLAWVHQGGTLLFYKDGAVVNAGVASGNTGLLTGTVRLCMGEAALSGHLPGQGVVAGAEIFATAVPPREIAAKAQARLHRFGTTARSGGWQLDSCATTGHGVVFLMSRAMAARSSVTMAPTRPVWHARATRS